MTPARMFDGDLYVLAADAVQMAENAYKNGQADEREACEALHDHEDVQAPIGNSSWGEAYQEGWAQGTAAYGDAIRARSNT